MATKRDFLLECPVHQAVIDKAVDIIEFIGYFSKEEVLRYTGYSAMRESISWEHVRGIIQDVHKVELVPLAQHFFNNMKSKKVTRDMRINESSRAIAGGNGKKTVGYASMTYENGIYGLRLLERKEAVAKGVIRVLDNTATTFNESNVVNDEGNVVRFVTTVRNASSDDVPMLDVVNRK